jgi:hypothetical protein
VSSPSVWGAVVVMLAVAACGGSSASTSAPRSTVIVKEPTKSTGAATHTTPAPPKPTFPPYPKLLPSVSDSAPTNFVPAVLWQGQTAAWIARTQSGIGLVSYNQQYVSLHLHSGTVDAGSLGFRWGPEVAASENQHLVGAFNGGFKFSTGAGGFMSFGNTAQPLRDGLASIVTYTDGSTEIGAWHQEVPAPGKTVASVRQNLTLLIDHGTAASSLDCLSCWGATLGGVVDPARSALGITSNGRLIWVGGEHLTAAALAQTLLGAHVVRAIELDINPAWVASYLYGHRGGAGPLAPVQVVPGQPGVSGQFLTPYSRDFFTLVVR